MLTQITPTFVIAILIAVAIHEWAHAYAAFKLGDPTAKYDGRLTVNPLAHLDPMGTLLFILIGFGWGKPVPVDPRYFKHPKRDSAIVAFAGPLSNIVLALLAFGIGLALGLGDAILPMFSAFMIPAEQSVFMQFAGELISDIILINLVLMAFNLLPIAPLDGSKIIRLFLPYRMEQKYMEWMQYGPWILLGLIIAGRVFGISILSVWITTIMTPFIALMDALL
ncbi:MAG: site-2 protease family protein [Candidatus Peregrinibacteria bacterium]|nr:site-2 protease family protein [Candidatus Peregrinibacteria bacterium]MCB9808067.1 site-2 protease family protein [Candidatus Peribacteria bacterium]